MSTPILKVITEYCEMYIDDIRMKELALTDAPLYARKMWGYLRIAIPLFTKPAEVRDFLLGTDPGTYLVEPQYTSAKATVAAEQTADYTIYLGEQYAGYSLCACRIKETDDLGNVYYTPISQFTYNAEVGSITIPAAEENPIPAGSTFDFDFYTDGQFANDLPVEVMNILGMCFSVAWQNRFNMNWLNMTPKPEDKSFFEQNRANKETADTKRLEELRKNLAEEMRAYEQNIAYKQQVGQSNRLQIKII